MKFLSTALIKTIIFVFLLINANVLFSQDKTYALSCVKTLSSPQFHGRGFVKKGDKIAAKFIQEELKKWNVKPFENSYQQQFKFDINTILKASLSTDTKTFILGSDYLVFAGSSSVKGKYQLYYPDSFSMEKFKAENHENEFFVLDTISYKSKDLIANYRNIIGTCAFGNAKGIIEITAKKLVQTQRTYEFGYAFIQIKNESWDSASQHVRVNIKNKFIEGYQSQNVIGYIEGEIDSFFVFGAHYDHLGRVGKNVYFPGANDNASGVATVLSLAKYYYDKGIKPKYNIAFMLFSAEEAGLIGSLYYTQNPLFPLNKIKLMFNLDMVGTGVEGLSVVNGKENPNVSHLLKKINTENNFFKDIRIGKGSANSDHHFFDKAGVPAVFLFTRGGPQYYHDVLDRSQTLEMNKLDQLIKMFDLFMHVKIDNKTNKDV